MSEYRVPRRERVAAQLRRDAESAARAGDISVRESSWRLAEIAYRLARDLNTAARLVELNLHIPPDYLPMVREAEKEED